MMAPPSLPERLLAWVLGPGPWTESILGDLHEDMHRSRASIGDARRSGTAVRPCGSVSGPPCGQCAANGASHNLRLPAVIPRCAPSCSTHDTPSVR